MKNLILVLTVSLISSSAFAQGFALTDFVPASNLAEKCADFRSVWQEISQLENSMRQTKNEQLKVEYLKTLETYVEIVKSKGSVQAGYGSTILLGGMKYLVKSKINLLRFEIPLGYLTVNDKRATDGVFNIQEKGIFKARFQPTIAGICEYLEGGTKPMDAANSILNRVLWDIKE